MHIDKFFALLIIVNALNFVVDWNWNQCSKDNSDFMWKHNKIALLKTKSTESQINTGTHSN